MSGLRQIERKGRFNIDGEWYQFGRKQGISFAETEKLVAPEISLGGNFSYDKKGEFYSTTTIYGYLKRANVSESYRCLLALLNSQLVWWYLTHTGTVLANGYFRFKPNYMNPFPLPQIIPQAEQRLLEELSDKVIQARMSEDRKKVSEYESQINTVIYRLYELREDEVEWIEAT